MLLPKEKLAQLQIQLVELLDNADDGKIYANLARDYYDHKYITNEALKARRFDIVEEVAELVDMYDRLYAIHYD